MKNKTLQALCLMFAGAATLTGCNEPAEEKQNLQLSQSVVSLLAADNTPVRVDVSAPGTWTAEPGEDWIIIPEKTDTYMTVTATDNTTGKAREAAIAIKCNGQDYSLIVSQVAPATVSEGYYRRLDDFQNGGVISENGLWIGGWELGLIEEDDSFTYTAVIIDTENDETYKIGPYPQVQYRFDLPYYITNDGRFFLLDKASTVMIEREGEITLITPPAEYANRVHVLNGTGDGTYWTGYIYAREQTRPLKWTNGVVEELPNPELTHNDMEYLYLDGIMAYGVSDDGRIVSGGFIQNDYSALGYWDANEGNKFHWVGEDVRKLEEVTMVDALGDEYQYNLFSGVQGTGVVSRDGKWIAGVYTEDGMTDDRVDLTIKEQCFCLYDVENKRTTKYPHLGGQVRYFTKDNMAVTTGGSIVDPNTGEVVGSIQDIAAGYNVNYSGNLVKIADNGVLFGTYTTQTPLGADTVPWYVVPGR